MTKRLDKKDVRIIKTKPNKIPDRILELLEFVFHESDMDAHRGIMLNNVRTFEAEITDEAFCEVTGWTPAKLRRFENEKRENIQMRDLSTYMKALGVTTHIIKPKFSNSYRYQLEFKNEN